MKDDKNENRNQFLKLLGMIVLIIGVVILTAYLTKP